MAFLAAVSVISLVIVLVVARVCPWVGCLLDCLRVWLHALLNFDSAAPPVAWWCCFGWRCGLLLGSLAVCMFVCHLVDRLLSCVVGGSVQSLSAWLIICLGELSVPSVGYLTGK